MQYLFPTGASWLNTRIAGNVQMGGRKYLKSPGRNIRSNVRRSVCLSTLVQDKAYPTWLLVHRLLNDFFNLLFVNFYSRLQLTRPIISPLFFPRSPSCPSVPSPTLTPTKSSTRPRSGSRTPGGGGSWTCWSSTPLSTTRNRR